MERDPKTYLKRVPVMTSLQLEASRAALKAQAVADRAEKNAKKHYWVRFNQLTIDHLNALMGKYEELTGYSPQPIDEEEFNRIREQFKSEYGIGEHEIQPGSNLEVIRRTGPNGELFGRCRIYGRHNGMQKEIDAYFISEKMEVTLRNTF